MTRRLIIIRHAKSSWDDPFGDDHARILNKRGKVSGEAIGNWLMVEGYLPDTVISSDAARAQQTAELVMQKLSPTPRLQLSGRLYHAAPDTILDVIQRQSDDTLAVVGHNPGMGMLANMLVKTAPKHNRFNDYPTCGTTVIDFAIDTWKDVKARTGRCQAFVVPRDLIGTSSHDIE